MSQIFDMLLNLALRNQLDNNRWGIDRPRPLLSNVPGLSAALATNRIATDRSG